MNDIISRLRAYDLGFNSPASATEIEEVATAIECNLPSDLRALYLDHNGFENAFPPPWRFMSISEVVEMYRCFSNWAGYGLRFFWTDDNSNYAGVYVSGPLAERVCIEIHDDHDLSPRFRSIRSFLEAVLVASSEERSLEESDFEYPIAGPKGNPGQLEDDWRAVQALRGLLDDSDDEQKRDYAKSMMALTPQEHTDQIVPFLDEDDMWIPATAARILGARKYEPAIPKLTEVGLTGRMNGYQTAIIALGNIGTKACLKALIRINDAKVCGHDYFLAGALEECGCQTREQGEGWEYRLRGSTNWVPILMS